MTLDALDAFTPITGVIFDFHSTLVEVRDPEAWAEAGHRRLGRPPSQIARLAEHLHRIWEHANEFDPHSERDLDTTRHHDVFVRAAQRHPEVDADLAEALYAVIAEQWKIFDDTLPVLAELKARGIKVAVLSNIGMDAHAYLEEVGIRALVDVVVLSYEVGAVKPDPQIFAHTLKALGLPAEDVLMVGDSWRDDAGAAGLGIRTLILPRTAGPVHGLSTVLRLV